MKKIAAKDAKNAKEESVKISGKCFARVRRRTNQRQIAWLIQGAKGSGDF